MFDQISYSSISSSDYLRFLLARAIFLWRRNRLPVFNYIFAPAKNCKVFNKKVDITQNAILNMCNDLLSTILSTHLTEYY